MRTVRQCPKCMLRFLSADELDDHLKRDHRVDPEALPDRHSGRKAEEPDREAQQEGDSS